MKKIMLTGFEVFSTNTVNPTEIIALSLSNKDGIKTKVLPVVWDECWEQIKDEECDIYLLMGLASSRKTITIERYAYNEKKASIPDNKGINGNSEKIAQDGDDRLETTLDINRLIELLKTEGIEVRLSEDPGRYICNNLYYHALMSKKEAFFVHLPSLENMALEKEKKAINIIINVLQQ